VKGGEQSERRLSRIGNAARLRQGFHPRRGYGGLVGGLTGGLVGGQANPACPERSPAPHGAGRSRRARIQPPDSSVWQSSEDCHPERSRRACLQLPESNRYTVRIEIAVTHSKQTAVVLSNRYKKSSPRGLATWLPFRPALYLSNRNTPETGLAVTLSKQTTAVLSNRNKKPPPGGVPSWLAFRPVLDLSLAARSVEANRNTLETGLAVTHSKQTAVVLSNRNKKPPPRGMSKC
jgi:hypothetical protein